MVRSRALASVMGSLLALVCFVVPTIAESSRMLSWETHVISVKAPVWGVAADAELPPDSVQPPRPIPIKLEGVVTETYDQLPGKFFIGDIAIIVPDETVVTPRGYVPQVGDYVIIDAILDGEAIVAHHVRIRAGNGVLNPIEFRGIITRLAETLYDDSEDEEWVIAGRLVEVDSRAVVGEPQVGYYAHVQGWVLANGKVRATHIKVISPAEAAAQFEFEGPVQEIALSAPGIWVIGGREGLVDDSTEIEGTPWIGTMAEVSGRQLQDGSLVFEHIRVLAEERTIRVEGLVEEVQISYARGSLEGYLIVEGTRVEIDEGTLIDESRGRLAIGMWAEVIARREWWGDRALRIRVERPD